MQDKIVDLINSNMPKAYEILYITKMGSHLYGTNSENSDLDVKFIFLPSIDDCLLGVASKNININSSNDKTSNTKDDVDLQGWSLQFFVELLRKGDTNAIDVLYSYTNHHCILFCSVFFKTLIKNATKFFDLSNMRGLLGYIVSQSEKYGLKGSRFNKFIEVKQIVDDVLLTIDQSVFPDMKLADIYSNIMDNVSDSVYCKFELTEDNRPAIRLCGKVHLLDISLYEFVKRINTEMARYGDRSKQALDGSDWKALSHAYRGIVQAQELLKTGNLSFPLKDANLIKDIKFGKLPRDFVNDLISYGLEEVKELLDEQERKKVDVFFTQNFILSAYNR